MFGQKKIPKDMGILMAIVAVARAAGVTPKEFHKVVSEMEKNYYYMSEVNEIESKLSKDIE